MEKSELTQDSGLTRVIQRYPVSGYFVMAYGFTWMIAVPLMLSASGQLPLQLPHELEMLAAFGPFAAALLVAFVCTGREGIVEVLRGLTKWRVGGFWLLFSVLTPFVLLLAGVMLVRLGSGVLPDFGSAGVLTLLTTAGLFELVIVAGAVQGLGEEPGWRGFALPRLRGRFGPLAASLVLFPFWLFWHLPAFLARPEFGLPQFLGFAVGILSATIWLTLIWDKTRSVLMAGLGDARVNVARGVAMAVSMPLFLAMSNAVLLGAAIIVIYWVVKKTKVNEI